MAETVLDRPSNARTFWVILRSEAARGSTSFGVLAVAVIAVSSEGFLPLRRPYMSEEAVALFVFRFI